MKRRLSSCSVRMENNLFFLILNSLGDYTWRRKVSLSKHQNIFLMNVALTLHCNSSHFCRMV